MLIFRNYSKKPDFKKKNNPTISLGTRIDEKRDKKKINDKQTNMAQRPKKKTA